MRVPLATYRLQFTPDFTFREAEKIADYLKSLGISGIYASPIFRARAGSRHGYDVVDPSELNPELGTPEDFAALSATVRRLQMGWLQDIVPNHMAFDAASPTLADVLENGPSSPHINDFDIDWDHYYENIRGKVLAPFLGQIFGRALEGGEIQLVFDQRGFSVSYYDLRFPLRIESYLSILTPVIGTLRQSLGEESPDYIQLLGVMYVLKTLRSEADSHERRDQVKFIKQTLWTLYGKTAAIRRALSGTIKTFNGMPGTPESFNALETLLADQWFRLSFWKVASEEINYRRFFSINDLISLQVDRREVFDRTHGLILRMVREGVFSGLRIDHLDGLYDPKRYLERLSREAGDLYIVIEKILARSEPLYPWPIQGTTGYEFLNHLNAIFVQSETQTAFTRGYASFTGQVQPYDRLVTDKKKLIIEKHMVGDVNNLAHLLKNIAGRHRYGSDITMDSLKQSLIEIMALFPVYRTYLDGAGALREFDLRMLRETLAKAGERNPGLRNELDFVGKILLLDYDDFTTEEERAQWLHFAMRFQQFTGPLMAKGFEDTLLYVYNRLLSLNDVGGAPECFGLPLAEFHTFNRDRRERWPHTLNTTATHDTKRGEDVRARLNVLSELPTEWNRHRKVWSRINTGKKGLLKRRKVPDKNDEYFFYQTLIGTFPFSDEEYPAYLDRIREYLIKAVREAKVHTAWLVHDTAYEEAFLQFAEKTLKPKNNAFLKAFLPFQRKIAHFGILNSLSQSLIKITAPGLPDFYQGTELWDLSLVDPDNRRAVDYAWRRAALKEIIERSKTNLPALLEELLAGKEDGRIKLFLIHRALQVRSRFPLLFQEGDYRPVTVEGKYRDHVVAFARCHGRQQLLTVAPRFLTALIEEGSWPLGEAVWEDTALRLPSAGCGVWQEEISGKEVVASQILPVGAILQQVPVALLIR